MRSMQGFACAAVACAVAVPAALAHDGDIGVAVVNGRIVIGLVAANAAETAEWVVPGTRVFGAELDATGFGAEPGLYGSELSEGGATTFPAGGRIGFSVLSPLMGWNGSGFASTDARMRIEFASGAQSVLTPAAGGVNGFFIDAGPTGTFDEHYDYFLTGAGGVGLPGAGVYLLSLSLTGETAAGGALDASDPFWVVFNFGGDEVDHEAAIQWAEANLAPTPGAAAVLLLGGMTLARRRRV